MNAVNTAHMSSFAPCFVLSVSRSESSRNRTCRIALKEKTNSYINYALFIMLLPNNVLNLWYFLTYLNHNHHHLEVQRHFLGRQMHAPKKVVTTVAYPYDEDHLPILLTLHLGPVIYMAQSKIYSSWEIGNTIPNAQN